MRWQLGMVGVVSVIAACAKDGGAGEDEQAGSSDGATDEAATNYDEDEAGDVESEAGEDEDEAGEDEDEAGEDEGASGPGEPQVRRWVLTRYDDGVESWSVQGPDDLVASAIAAGSNGDVLLGAKGPDLLAPSALVRVDVGGEIVQQLDLEDDAYVRDLAVDASGHVYLVGDDAGAMYVAAVADDFSSHWSAHSTTTVSPGVSRRAHVALEPAGTLVYADSTETSASLVRFDAEGGEAWSIAWPGAEAETGELADLVVTADGTIVLAIGTGDAESGDLWLDAFDLDGNELWATTQADISTNGVGVTAAGTIVASGMELIFEGGGITDNGWIAGHDATGARTWETRTELPPVPGRVHGCTQGFVVAMDGARHFADDGRLLAELPHAETGGMVGDLDAVCTSDGGIVVLGIATITE